MLGIFLKSNRAKQNVSIEELSKKSSISTSDLKLIESGVKNLSQEEFDMLRVQMNISGQELIEISKVSQVHYLSNLLMALDDAK